MLDEPYGQLLRNADLTPDPAAYDRLARKCRLIPVSCRFAADTVTPVSLFLRFDDHESAFLLESVIGGERWARYSIMGRRPLLRLTCRGSQIRLSGPLAAVFPEPGPDPVELIRRLLEAFRLPPELANDGFRCGLVGSFSYDFVRYLEHLPEHRDDSLELPDCDLIVPAEVVLYDHLKNELILICVAAASESDFPAYSQIIEQMQLMLELLFGRTGRQPAAPVIRALSRASRPRAPGHSFRAGTTRDDWLAAVRRAKQYILAGDIFQVVLSQRFTAAAAAAPFDIYRALRRLNPSPYLFYLRSADAVLVGASPEMLVRVAGSQIETCPIAGTRRRGHSPAEDDRLAAELLADEKERAEHAMLVDLARNDVGRISVFGSVALNRYCQVERFSHVMHLVSDVTGRLRDDRSMIDVLAALLPAGTLSGAPKVRAMEIIAELEPEKRGPYGGAVGYLGFDGRMDTCITIRTAVIRQGLMHVQAGAGIVADSVPETEFEETRHKAMALFAAIEEAEANDDSAAGQL